MERLPKRLEASCQSKYWLLLLKYSIRKNGNGLVDCIKAYLKQF